MWKDFLTIDGVDFLWVFLCVTWIGITSSHSISAEPGWMASLDRARFRARARARVRARTRATA